MKRNNLILVLFGVVTVISLYLAWLLIEPFYYHSKMIIAHAKSGSFKVQSENISIDNHVRNYLLPDEKLYYIQNAVNDFPIRSESEIISAINFIGKSTIIPNNSQIRYNSNRLPQVYGNLLHRTIFSESKRILEANPNKDFNKFQRLIDNIDRFNDINKLQIFIAEIEDKVEFTETLSLALEDFRNGGTAFKVATKEEFDNPDKPWESYSNILKDKTLKISGHLFLSTTDSIPVNLMQYPRLATIEIERSWLDNGLLNEMKSNRELEDYFGLNGTLKEIPEKLIIQFNNYIEIELFNKSDLKKLKEDPPKIAIIKSYNLGIHTSFEVADLEEVKGEGKLLIKGENLPKYQKINAIVVKVRKL